MFERGNFITLYVQMMNSRNVFNNGIDKQLVVLYRLVSIPPIRQILAGRKSSGHKANRP